MINEYIRKTSTKKILIIKLKKLFSKQKEAY